MAWFALLVWLLGTPMWIWLGYVIRHMEGRPLSTFRWFTRIEREADAETVPPRPSSLRRCEPCGDLYHPSWGSMCPNCSGAD